eukprot:scpid47885/ scgid0663/ Large subunit GTPase 1 homolog
MGRGQNKKAGGLGRSIVKDRKRDTKGARGGDSWLHTSEIDDTPDWARLNLTSVTEQSSLDNFLSTAELAGTEFTAERLNVKVVTPGATVGLLSTEQTQAVKDAQEKNSHYLHIPRRPRWDESTTGEHLQYMEREAFLEWRRQLARLEEQEHLTLTPFERNLEFWRQLWRVVERSDVVVQIVDARNPLLFRSDDLVSYVKECGAGKQNFLLLNKSDLLTQEQRDAWAAHFRQEGIEAAFWSALDETDPPKEEEAEATGGKTRADESSEEDDSESDDDDDDTEEEAEDNSGEAPDMSALRLATSPSGSESSVGTPQLATSPPSSQAAASGQSSCTVADDAEVNRHEVCSPPPAAAAATSSSSEPDWRTGPFRTSGRLFSRSELVDLFKMFRLKGKDRAIVGLVGYPNVGKSSTINALLQYKKVPVSATPGRTKHFQTLLLDDDLMLCDCPGLVFPQFVSTKAEMVCSGILPIDQMRDHEGPINFICHKIPRFILQKLYGIMLPKPAEGEDPNRPPLPLEVLMSYGYVRGFMTTKGVPDCPRSARIILKDYVKGRLLYCHAPPGVDEATFQYHHQHLERLIKEKAASAKPTAATSAAQARIPKALKILHTKNTTTIDQAFFEEKQPRAISRGKHGRTIEFTRVDGFTKHVGLVQPVGDGDAIGDQLAGLPDDLSDTASIASSTSSYYVGGKPWKKHHNRGKKEKTRRLVNNDY